MSAKADRLPPYSPEAEAGVLGCLLLDAVNGLGECQLKFGSASPFFDMRHQLIYDAIEALSEKKVGVDVVTLSQALKDRGTLEEVGGMVYLAGLSDKVPSASNLSYYLEIVWEKHLLRKLLQACTELSAQVYDTEKEAPLLVAEAHTRLLELSEAGLKTVEKTMAEVVKDVTANVLEVYRRGHKMRVGPQTGFNYLDNILPGFGKGQLIVEAARPRTGKSAKLMQTAEHVALVEKVPVAVFSLEMSARSLGSRAIFQKAGSDYTKFCNGFLMEADVEKLTAAALQLNRAPIYIDESPRMCIEDFEVRARRMVRRHGVGMIFVDYFQLMYVRNAKRQWSKSDELAEVSMRLKGLAKELDLPIYLAAQMNRQIEQDVNRRPRLSDLRDTGQLEQDADVVMFLWKPEPPEDPTKIERILSRIECPDSWKTFDLNDERKRWPHYLTLVNCTVEKQREGRSGEDALLVFIKPWTRFVDGYRPAKENL